MWPHSISAPGKKRLEVYTKPPTTYVHTIDVAVISQLNAVADIGDTCNDGRTPTVNDTECTQGYNTSCHIGVAKFGTEDGSCPFSK